MPQHFFVGREFRKAFFFIRFRAFLQDDSSLPGAAAFTLVIKFEVDDMSADIEYFRITVGEGLAPPAE